MQKIVKVATKESDESKNKKSFLEGRLVSKDSSTATLVM